MHARIAVSTWIESPQRCHRLATCLLSLLYHRQVLSQQKKKKKLMDNPNPLPAQQDPTKMSHNDSKLNSDGRCKCNNPGRFVFKHKKQSNNFSGEVMQCKQRFPNTQFRFAWRGVIL
ncbi:hypothetical protein BO86DRAFT_123912 [Aspergillus japonicus CBS 114.51]|uniref:Uncharacterized protein n=1 Tax=Aspergillus japonicus CBS 114.51 TaxID=1448312 RepID=A0A8T8WXK8_ASPJA|nr:hypothetical protein BO86DRAFT_123912 [Aspergillus japonicus CBS 114.51]RAH80578.1 hypothetical protein BO86DRAFT_123912 [Aspergillus japonicus CBS 114.51]